MKIATITTTFVLAALAPAAAHAAVTPGARYDGAGGKPAIRQTVKISKDAKKLSSYFLASNGRCNDGKVFLTNTELGSPRTVTLDATGAFTHTLTAKRAVLIHGKKHYDGTQRTTITGRSTPDGSAITVTIAGTFVAKGLRCNSAATVTLNRDGTPGAPFSDSRMTTGRYPGLTKGRLRIAAFRTFAPGGELRKFVVSGRARCSDGRDLPVGTSFDVLRITPRDTFSVSGAIRTKSRARPGYRALFADRLRLRFFRRGASYGYSGSYGALVSLTKRGKRAIICKLPETRFETLVPSVTPQAG